MGEIQKSLVKDAGDDIEESAADMIDSASAPLGLNGSGSIPFEFRLSEKGRFHYEIEKYGVGKTIDVEAWIEMPDATYAVTVTSSDGGGGHWEDVGVGQKVQCEIRTSFWHSTRIIIDIHASARGELGKGYIYYKY